MEPESIKSYDTLMGNPDASEVWSNERNKFITGSMFAEAINKTIDDDDTEIFAKFAFKEEDDEAVADEEESDEEEAPVVAVAVEKQPQLPPKKIIPLALPEHLKKYIPADIVEEIPYLYTDMTIEQLEKLFVPPHILFLRNNHVEEELDEIFDDNVEAMFECKCCFMEYEMKHKIECSYGHEHCTNCVINWATEKITGGNSLIKCITDSSCGGIFNIKKLKKILPQQIYNALEEKALHEAIDLAEIPDLYTCPKCVSYSVSIDEMYIKANNITKFECMNVNCKYASCIKCKKESHSGSSCEYINRDVGVRKEIEELLTKNRVRLCSNTSCGNKFVRLDGCCAMACTKCGHNTCYVCGGKIASGHFGGEYEPSADGKCAKYYSEENVNKLSVSNAIKEIFNKYNSENNATKFKESYAILIELEKDSTVTINEYYLKKLGEISTNESKSVDSKSTSDDKSIEHKLSFIEKMMVGLFHK
jgi:hypothetical protein